jgi:chorismate-pyruvate lyase
VAARPGAELLRRQRPAAQLAADAGPADAAHARHLRRALPDEHPQRAQRRGDHLREIELCCDGIAWVWAQTRVPAATLAAQGWLAAIGQTALGEALAAHGAVRRPEFDYARLYDDVDVVSAALARRALPAQPLWVRRSVFDLGLPAHSLTLREVFLPDVGQLRPSPP